MSNLTPPPNRPPSVLETSSDGPVVEAKVKTSSAAAAAVGLVLSLVQLWIFRGESVPPALAVAVTSVVSTVVSGGLTFIVGWLTRHTPRALLEIEEDQLG